MRSLNLPQKPYAFNFSTRIEWSTVSNAFFKSMKNANPIYFWSFVVLINSVTLAIAWMQECFSRKPYCSGILVLCFLIKDNILLCSNFSKILLKTVSRLIGR